MPTGPLSLGLPDGVDPGAADRKQVPGALTNGTLENSWTVPGGEVWLVQSLLAIYSAGAAAVPRTVFCDYYDSDANLFSRSEPQGHFVTSNPTVVSFALGFDSGGQNVSSAGSTYGPLPWLVLLPQSFIQLAIQDAVGGDPGFLVGQATVTFWELGAAGAVEPVGPFMYVEGFGVAAA